MLGDSVCPSSPYPENMLGDTWYLAGARRPVFIRITVTLAEPSSSESETVSRRDAREVSSCCVDDAVDAYRCGLGLFFFASASFASVLGDLSARGVVFPRGDSGGDMLASVAMIDNDASMRRRFSDSASCAAIVPSSTCAFRFAHCRV